jgi:hypothetical protein
MRLTLLSLVLLSASAVAFAAETGSNGGSSGGSSSSPGTGNAELDAMLRSSGSESRNIEFELQTRTQGGADSMVAAIARCRALESDESERNACEARARRGR